MSISKNIEFAPVEALWLDPQNPRIGRVKRRENPTQNELLAIMSTWTLDELVDSFLNAGGFWTQDALIIVKEIHDGEEKLVVVEGNRRLAALKLMMRGLSGLPHVPRPILDKLRDANIALDDELFQAVPYLLAEQRSDVAAYLGFRHVTGIKEWPPTEKAEFITQLIEGGGLTYRDVARQIGSRSDVVKHNYIAFKILEQVEGAFQDDEWVDRIESKFSVLLLSLRSTKVRDFLGIDTTSDAEKGQRDIVPVSKRDDLQRFIEWVFGTKTKKAIVRDSRQIDRFADVLSEPRSIAYLYETPDPKFEIAYSLTRAAADLVIDPLQEAHRQLTLAMAQLPGRAEEPGVQEHAWPVIEGGIDLARALNGQILTRAKERIVAP